MKHDILYIYICNRLRLYFHPQQLYQYPHSYPISGWLISIISPELSKYFWLILQSSHFQLKWIKMGYTSRITISNHLSIVNGRIADISFTHIVLPLIMGDEMRL